MNCKMKKKILNTYDKISFPYVSIFINKFVSNGALKYALIFKMFKDAILLSVFIFHTGNSGRPLK